jgi:AcrR family transcriptional regulator
MENDTALVGRPRSEEARRAVLHAVDDLLLEVGYAGMTMKGIADRAGVGRQTVYRWWSTKAEILLEASADDAEQELAIVSGVDDDATTLQRYLEALSTFMTASPAGIAYRALLAAAQHDAAVALLIAARDPVSESAQTVVSTLRESHLAVTAEEAAARLVGPTVFWILTGRDPAGLNSEHLAGAAIRGLFL